MDLTANRGWFYPPSRALPGRKSFEDLQGQQPRWLVVYQNVEGARAVGADANLVATCYVSKGYIYGLQSGL